jgi:SAM-dependent MidA family methyltransferase
MARAAAGEFESATENTALVELIRARIEAEGGITFRDFMDLALYHPALGYYATREPMGRERDFLTSPEVHPVFGAMVGKQIAQFWEHMQLPATFEVVEQGAGTGLLARDILFWARRNAPDFSDALRYRIVEISDSLRRRQEQTLAALGEAPVAWLDSLPRGIEGCVLSNELIDSFPVHRVVVRKGELLEMFVTLGDGELVKELRPLSDGRIAAYFDALGLLPGEGCVAEVNLRAVDWMREVASKLARGFVLTFDYGYEAPELYAPWRKDGTLMCFYRHNPSDDPYARIGKQDMTSHVDFTTLMREGETNGLAVAGLTTQARFLSNMGIGVGVDAVARESPGALEEYYARRRAVQDLIDPAGLGRVSVLAQRKGVEPSDMAGFAEDA